MVATYGDCGRGGGSFGRVSSISSGSSGGGGGLGGFRRIFGVRRIVATFSSSVDGYS